jgi:hypothetical protein
MDDCQCRTQILSQPGPAGYVVEFLAKRKSRAQGNNFPIPDFSFLFSVLGSLVQLVVGGTSHTNVVVGQVK